ncbi:flavoprotein [Pseudonocardia lacus]|uniref:flavoprotein n=1 Tax=Pseudonocardia lacus TaxID=2835865 RepID=UPI001BDBF639|nr:flavoprotein [Pseudonocardia lacus]
MGGTTRTLGLVGSGAGGVEGLRGGLVEPLVRSGWRIAVTLTPTAGRWLRATGAADELARITGLPVRVDARMPGDSRPHPSADVYAVVPASANTIAKLAVGIADNQALTTINEAIGTPGVPVVVFPRINAAHARHPRWDSHVAALRAAGVHLVDGEDVWPLHEARAEPPRDLPWQHIRERIVTATA